MPIDDRIGQTNIANNGMKMTIIAYRSAVDIDVQFEDGAIVKNKKYQNFKLGIISHPDYINCMKKGSRIGETSIANNGMKMTIVKYNNISDIDIQFEDGIMVKHKRYQQFKLGHIKHPYYEQRVNVHDRLGETNVANNGQKMTIIAYHGANNIDIQFDDGTIVNNKSYDSFKRGGITNPNYKIYRIGQTRIANNGMKMTIVAYRSYHDIDIQFEDGVIVNNKSYRSFKEGGIGHPKYTNSAYKNSRVGETSISTNGMKMSIIAYRTVNDVDIQFEDGTIVENKRYQDFIHGHIKHPYYNYSNINVGKENIANNGMKMTIIAYRKSTDIDVQFEDGCIVKHKTYTNFKRSIVKHEFPYQMDDMIIEKPAYIHDKIGNFYCHCTLCGKRDIMTVSEAKNHQCSESMTG